jgi:hypothetical protein
VLAAAQTPAQAAPSVRVSVQVPAQATPTIGVDGVPPIQADVVVPPAPGTAAPAPVATHGIATSRPAGTAATKKRADTTRPRAAPPPRTVASPFLHPGIGASIAGRGSAAAAASAAQSSSHVSTRRETPRARTPELPLPFGPTGPALPDSGAASPGGQGSGAGAPLLVLLAVLGGLTVFGIPILLRKVLWSDLWMPRLVALPPWRPG